MFRDKTAHEKHTHVILRNTSMESQRPELERTLKIMENGTLISQRRKLRSEGLYNLVKIRYG